MSLYIKIFFSSYCNLIGHQFKYLDECLWICMYDDLKNKQSTKTHLINISIDLLLSVCAQKVD